MPLVLHFTAHRVDNGRVKPTERAINGRRSNFSVGSPRRARRRTLFAPTAPPRAEPDHEPEIDSDCALEEYVIDGDEYPEVTAAQRRTEPAASEPDRVDDIDQWLEEFAVSDCLDALPR